MKNTAKQTRISSVRIFIKVGLILIIFNFVWILISKLPIGKISLYNDLFAGRDRLPFGENPIGSYNLSLYDLDAMFASHVIDGKELSKGDITKIVLIGDSSIWGFLQKPEQTLSGLLSKILKNKDQNIKLYNLGYPSISVIKDMMMIEKSLEYKPDLILWFTTLEALPKKNQLAAPIVENNPNLVNQLIDKYEIQDISIQKEDNFNRTFWNQRRNIANLINLQIYGILWSATGVDQEYPENYTNALRDFEIPIEEYYGFSSDEKLSDHLTFDVIKNVIDANSDIDFILINEPILISRGQNSSLQYNFYYPRWAYDQYRLAIGAFAEENNIPYYDFWNLIQENEFTNSAIHLTVDGEEILAEEIARIIAQYLSQKGLNE